MVNANKKGREAENRLATWFTVHGYPNELIRLQGVNDAGDMWLPYIDTRVEVKNHVAVLSAINEAIKDVYRLDERFPLSHNRAVVARPGQPVNKWYVVTTVEKMWPPLPENGGWVRGDDGWEHRAPTALP
jgi:hypothetical protein